MKGQKIFKYLLLTSVFMLATSLIAYFIGIKNLPGLLLVTGFVAMAFGVRGYVFLKGFSYTVWIFAAVSTSMLYPSLFIQVGSFELKMLIVPLLQLIMFGMGSQMSFDDFKGIIKMPKGVFIGVMLQYSVMPLVGFTLANIFKFPREIAAGILLIGCAPSGLASNVMSYIAKANVALAVTLAAVGTILSPFLTPLLMKLLAGQYIEVDFWAMMNEIIEIIILPIVAGFVFKLFNSEKVNKRNAVIQITSFLSIIILKNVMLHFTVSVEILSLWSGLIRNTVWFLLLPAIGGYFLKLYLNKWFQIEKALSFLSMFGIAFIITIITAAGRDNLLKVGILLILVSLIHNLSGYLLGYSVSRLFKLPENDCRTIAFEVGMQNGGLASGLALQMGKLATVGLAPAVFGPLMNITGSSLATWWRSKS
jgi:BASS family bile acid:Na+ symporter